MYPSGLQAALLQGPTPMNQPMFQYLPHLAHPLAPPPQMAQPPPEVLQQTMNRPAMSAMQPRSAEDYMNGGLHMQQYVLPPSGPPQSSHNNVTTPVGTGAPQYLELAVLQNTGAPVGYGPPGSVSMPAVPTSQYQQQQQQQQQQYITGPPGDTVPASGSGSTPQTPTSAQPLNAAVDSSSKLWKDLKMQLEYYFSPQNLEKDDHLKQNMDLDGYVPVRMIAGFNKVVSLTKDVHLVTCVLRDSTKVQVDPTGEKVRPLLNSGTLMLREIPENTPPAEVERLFDHPRCPRLVNCYFGLADHWYATFETHEAAVRAYTYLKEHEIAFRGKPVLVRIKSTAPIASYCRGRPSDVPPSPFTPTQGTAPPPPQQGRPPSYTTSPAMALPPAPQQAPIAVPPVAQPVPPPALYQEPPPQAPARVFTPQPAVVQPPPPALQPVMQQPPPQAVTIQTQQHQMPPQPHQLPPGTVQLVPAPVNLNQNYSVIPQNVAWPQQFFFDNFGQMLVPRPPAGTPLLYDFGAQPRIQFQDLRFRPQQRGATIVVPVVSHSAFVNPGGAPMSAANLYAASSIQRPPRRDSTVEMRSRFSINPAAPRPSSAPYRGVESYMPQPMPSRGGGMPPVTPLLPAESATPPATVDVASATSDASNVADIDVTTGANHAVEQQPVAMVAPPLGNMPVTTSHQHHVEPIVPTSVPAEPPVNRRMPPPNNWRQHDNRDMPNRSNPRRGRGGRHYDDNTGRQWNSREPPVEQKFNFEANNFPPLTSAPTTSVEDSSRFSTLSSGGGDDSRTHQQQFVHQPQHGAPAAVHQQHGAGGGVPAVDVHSTVSPASLAATASAGTAAQKSASVGGGVSGTQHDTVGLPATEGGNVGQFSPAAESNRLLNDGNSGSASVGTSNDSDSASEHGKQGSSRLSYAQIAQRGGGSKETTVTTLPQAATLSGTEAETVVPAAGEPDVSPVQTTRHHDLPPHHGAAHDVNTADRHMPPRRGGRGGGPGGRYRLFYPSDSAQGRGGGRYRGSGHGGPHDGYVAAGPPRADRMIADEQPTVAAAAAQQS